VTSLEAASALRRTEAILLLLLFLCPILVTGQRGGRENSSNSTLRAPPMKGVVIAVRGKLKEITKKKIVIQPDDNQIMTIRRNAKTRFVSNDTEIKPFEIDLDSAVSIDVTEDNDLKLVAIVVRADKPQKKRPLASR
jgi:hypothetical protein